MIPRILIIDDLYGRVLSSRRNPERESLCAKFLLEDASGDSTGVSNVQITSVAESIDVISQVNSRNAITATRGTTRTPRFWITETVATA